MTNWNVKCPNCSEDMEIVRYAGQPYRYWAKCWGCEKEYDFKLEAF